ncbi:MAG: hypothetical protein KDK97_13930 [Verrucomicrobiales bacterium]|nr:hypothetical protein [Verrucomicrobiales bacterium]MCP5559841.1 hypothetical protein [Verrucomicrobiaceae bacterium]
MKTILAILAIVTALGIATPNAAQADCGSGARRIVSYLPCGRPVYATYQVIGFDRCGNPIGQWVTSRPSCACSVCNPRPSYGSSYGGYRGSYGGHSHGGSSCDRGGSYYGRPSSGVRWSFSFGR